MHLTLRASTSVAAKTVSKARSGSIWKRAQMSGKWASVIGLFVLTPNSTWADTPAPGYQVAVESAAPGIVVDPFGFGFDVTGIGATLSNGDLIEFDGLNLRRLDSSGALVQTYLTLASAVFPSFVSVAPDESIALAGESSNGVIYKIELATGATTPLTSLGFNYDAAFFSANEVVVSAGDSGLGNDLIRVNTDTGLTSPIANVSGFSGPVEVGGNGQIFYGSTVQNDVLVFTATDVQSGMLLGDGDALVHSTGWDSVGYLEFDPLTKDLLLVENAFGSAPAIYRVIGNKAGSELIASADSGLTIGKPQVFKGSAAATFESFQPSFGDRLVYQTTNFANSRIERFTAEPRRASVSVSGPGLLGFGSIEYKVENALPSGTMILFYGPSALAPMDESAVLFSSLPPLFWNLDLGTQRFIPFFLPADANGTVSFTFFNPNTLQGNVSVQGLLGDTMGGTIGTAPVGHL